MGLSYFKVTLDMKQQDFFNRVGPLAMQSCKGTGLCASVTLAQAALESAWGASKLATQANNFFGIKAGKTWTGAKIWLQTKEQDKNGKESVIWAAFRSYKSPQDCFNDRVRLFRAWTRYSNLFQKTDAATEARQLKADGYATDTRYPEKLIAIVTQYGLTKYDDK